MVQVYPHGSTDSLPYATMGSGSLNAMAVFEEGFKDGLERDEAVALVARAIRSGIFNDLGSGSNVDVCVITRGKVRGAGAVWGRYIERVDGVWQLDPLRKMHVKHYHLGEHVGHPKPSSKEKTLGW